MRFAVVVFAGIVCLSIMVVAPAAEPGSKTSVDPQATKSLEMSEDLEIMGEVLRSALVGLYPQWVKSQPAAANHYLNLGFDPATGAPRAEPVAKALDFLSKNADESGPFYDYRQFVDPVAGNRKLQLPRVVTEAAVKRPEGTYLDGYGVVYQMTIDAPPAKERQPEESVEPEAPRGPGPWQRAAGKLRGQPVATHTAKAQKKRRAPTKDELVDKLLDVMAESAADFRHLKPSDRLAVAIKFPRSARRANPSTASADKSTTQSAIVAQQAVSDYQALTQQSNAAAASGFQYLLNLQAVGGQPPSSRDGRSSHEVSGDLHMRQRNYKQAVEAYQKALEMEPGDYAAARKRALAAKLIQGHLGVSDLEEARKLLELLLNKTTGPDPDRQADASRKASKPAIPLPAKLVVSVPKSRLDEVAAGKLKREDLNQHATIRYINPPSDRPGLGSPRSRTSSSGGHPQQWWGGVYHR